MLIAALLAAACASGSPRELDPFLVPSSAPVTVVTEIPRPTPTPTTPPLAEDAATPEVTGTFPLDNADEISGIVVSAVDPDVIWMVDDDPGTDALIAVRLDGTILGRATMAGVSGVNIEDLAAGPCEPGSTERCLYVGDIGDNVRARPTVLVHRLAEPDPALLPLAVEVDTATLTYPEQPVDAEALAVTPDGDVVVLSKRDQISFVFVADGFGDGVLQQVATLEIPEPNRPLLTLATGLALTGAELSPDGRRLLLRTYDSVVELTAPDDADLAGVAEWSAVELPAGPEPQGEAVTYLADGRSVVTVSERSGDITVLRRP